MIFLCGSLAIWFVSRKEDWKRWGYIIGLIGQPFWIYTAYQQHQWGLFLLTLIYTYSWSQGIYNYWIKTDMNNLICADEKEISCDFCEKREKCTIVNSDKCIINICKKCLKKFYKEII